MALNINTNIGALGAAAAASSVNKSMETSMTRLSTGLRINTAADDAAGVAIASRLSSEIRGTNMAIRNAMDAQAMIDTAEGAHAEIENILQRMRELAVQAANDTNGTSDRTALQAELTQLTEEIDRIAATTTWAGISLLNGGAAAGSVNGTADTAQTFNYQISTNTAGTGDTMDISIKDIGSLSLGLSGTGTVSIDNITESNTTGNTADIANLSTSTAGNITLNGSELTVAAYEAGDVISVDIDGVTVSFTEGAGNDSYTGDKAGVAGRLAQEINDAGIPGITAASDGTDTVTITKAGTDSSLTSAANQLTVASYDAGETLSVDLDGTTVSITTGATGYTADVTGAAAQLTQAINDAGISGVSASSAAGVITLTKSTSVSVATNAAAQTAIGNIDDAISELNAQRASLGAYSNRLDSTVANLSNVAIQLEGGKSRIMDADFAAESTNLAKAQILQQASTAMLAQANASKQGVLQLLQG